jgi:hypothetical protein
VRRVPSLLKLTRFNMQENKSTGFCMLWIFCGLLQKSSLSGSSSLSSLSSAQVMTCTYNASHMRIDFIRTLNMVRKRLLSFGRQSKGLDQGGSVELLDPPRPKL